jgi:hypothetical protein
LAETMAGIGQKPSHGTLPPMSRKKVLLRASN